MSAGQTASNQVQRETEAEIRRVADETKGRYMRIISQGHAGRSLAEVLEFLKSAYAHDVAAIDADRTIGMHLRENVRLANIARVQNRGYRIQGLKVLHKEGTRIAAYEIYETFKNEEDRARAAIDREAQAFRRSSETVARMFEEKIAAYEASRVAAVAAAAAPRAASPRAASPRAASPPAAAPRAASPRAASPRAASPRAASPRAASPRAASPPAAAPRAASPRAASPRAASPRAAGGARRTKRKSSKAKKSRKHK